jgi:hypothetical protein
MTFIFEPLFRYEWENRHMPGPFDGFRQLPLMDGTDTANPPGENFSAFRNEVRKHPPVFVIDIGHFFGAKFANSLTPNGKPFWSWHELYLSAKWAAHMAALPTKLPD